MATFITRRGLVFGAGLAFAGVGCGGMNPFLIPYLFGAHNTNTPAEFPLKPIGKNKEAKVVILVSSKTGLPADLTGVDRMLNAELIQTLETRLKESEEKVQILKMPALDKFKNDTPNWRSAKPYDVGKQFGADYMIDVEIQEMDLFKPGSRGKWLQGRAVVSVNVYELSKPLKEPAGKWDLEFAYPRDREIEVETRSHISTFRTAFVQRIASDVSIKFSSTPTGQRRLD